MEHSSLNVLDINQVDPYLSNELADVEIAADWILAAASEQNIYIVGGVATGKTTLAQQLERTLPEAYAIDMGRLFRVATKHILDASEVSPALLDAVQAGDPKAREDLTQTAGRQGTVVRNQFKKLELAKCGGYGNLAQDDELVDEMLLDPRIELAVPYIAQAARVRQTVWNWVHNTASQKDRIILTGHNLHDIDTAAYTLVPLTVSPHIAVERSRDRPAYIDKPDSVVASHIATRDQRDGVHGMLKTVDYLGIEPIDTDSLTESAVCTAALHSLASQAFTEHSRRQRHTERLEPREQFNWETNQLVTAIRSAAADIYTEVANSGNYGAVTEFDAAIQTMITLCGHNPEEVWLGDQLKLNEILGYLAKERVTAANQLLKEGLANGSLYPNRELIYRQAHLQAARLQQRIEECGDFAIGTCNDPLASPFTHPAPEITTKGRSVHYDEANDVFVQVREKHTNKIITIRPIDADLSRACAQSLHYLHSPRTDEYAAFAAFTDNSDMPFAWVSYSPVDRAYKKELLRGIGVEPQCTLEMTRAWNAPWAPKNTISTLFSFAHNQLQRAWQKDSIYQGKVLAGVITAINPNLGFQAYGFKGTGFGVVGLKPATFTYLRQEDGDLTYMPRRTIARTLGVEAAELSVHPQFIESRFPLLPTYEMAVLFRGTDRYQYNGPIYRITDDAYRKHVS